MKILFTYLSVILFSGFTLPPLTHINMGYTQVMRTNGIFALNQEEYGNQYYFFARDREANYGIIRFEGRDNIHLPLKTKMKKGRKNGTEWAEIFANDSITVNLKGVPMEAHITRKYSYNVDFEMIWKTDTIREKLIGHCDY